MRASGTPHLSEGGGTLTTMTSPTALPTSLMRPPKVPASLPKPVPLGSLVSSAQRLTSTTRSGRQGGKAPDWQNDCWEMFDLVGELRFLSVTIAGRMGSARFYVGELDEQTDQPVQVEDPELAGILDAVGDSPAAFAQLVVRLGVNLFVAGDGYLVGVPSDLLPGSQTVADGFNVDPALTPLGFIAPPKPAGLAIEDLRWRMLSVSEVTPTLAGNITLHLGESEAEKVVCRPEDVFLIRVWRPHPRRSWEADSPTRSSLSVLREIVGLTTKISAQIDSRLAGAGLLLVPLSADRALKAQANLAEDSTENPLMDALIEAMMTPIIDRGVASAVVPLIATVPDDTVDLFRHMTFEHAADDKDTERRDAAIRRLALGQDAPPELLLGSGSMSHWGAWLSKEDVITSHVEPPLALVCDALTTQYLWPVLREMGMDETAAHRYVIWYDVSDLVVRPNESQDAFALHAAGIISDEALRSATGTDESAAPEYQKDLPPEVLIAMKLVEANPALLSAPGLPQVVAQIKAALTGDIPAVAGAAPAAPPPGGGPVPPGQPGGPPTGQPGPPSGGLPQTAGNPAPTPGPPQAVAASGNWGQYPTGGPNRPIGGTIL